MAAPKKTATPNVALMSPIVYVGSKGLPKAALVVGTPETVQPGHSLPELNEGQLHIIVWEFSAGHFVPKLNVPYVATVAENDEFKNADGVTVGVWQLA